ncbi:MAG: hypothetical protein QOK43_2407 [Acidimicrobiaceae bacterium]|nr:hypothetical protein [Acidimicrobiaceae bacterium]
MPDVRLVDLDLIKRYSLALRQESAPADELLAALDATKEQVLAALAGTQPAPPTPPARTRRSPRRRATP